MIDREGGPEPLEIDKGDTSKMKKIMSLMLGLSLLTGAAAVVFAQDKGTDTEKQGKKGKKGKKGTDTESAPKSK